MSRTHKDKPFEVLANSGTNGWYWEERWYSWSFAPLHMCRYPVHPEHPSCYGKNVSLKLDRRLYWRAERSIARQTLRMGIEPEPSRPRHDILYHLH